jgi:hypothetical protein
MVGQSIMQITFSGCPEAEMFTHEVTESLAGVLSKNCQAYMDPQKGIVEPGFVTASVDGRFWYDTMWTRDAGVFLREMAHWGCIEQGIQTARCLFRLMLPNAQGYRMFPMYFNPGQPASGTELDGTAAIIIGSVLLGERLAIGDPVRQELWNDLTGPESPVAGLLAETAQASLVAGSGEFGGGCGIEGEFFNIVQNNLVRLALLAVAGFAKTQEAPDLAVNCIEAAGRLQEGMLANLRYQDGTWIWCRRAPDLTMDWTVLAHEINAGFGGINGVLAMSSDVLGLLPAAQNQPWLQPSIHTFLQLLSQPSRLQQFAQYGAWTQFDRYWGGYLTGPSYGHGYAVQCMQLMDWPELYTPAINWLARATCQLLPGHELHRDSDYWFYERYYTPDAVGQVNMEEGCGALNLVCVMEPLKIARQILGVDDAPGLGGAFTNLAAGGLAQSHGRIRIIPRLPLGWTYLEARQVPVLTSDGLARADVGVTATREGGIKDVTIHADHPLGQVVVRLGTARQPEWRIFNLPG